jgi:hypothetical protein
VNKQSSFHYLRAIDVPWMPSREQNVGLSMQAAYNQAEGDMGEAVLEAGGDERELPCAYERNVRNEHFNEMPLIEISDKDYRSFCWPCHALEDTGDCQ